MNPRLAPDARYRVVPHPSGVGACAIVADEAAPLSDTRTKALLDWLNGPLHPVTPTGRTQDFTSRYAYDSYPDAPLYDVGGTLRALAPDRAALLAAPMIATILGGGPDRTRIFGFAADGTLIVAIATLDPKKLTTEEAPDAA